ncbi:MAG: PleD family two-component system response regulator [Alphaproteobacteria bacterium]|nr:PleD family two-component system response regulator [Alphaproteobacteria bacterium]MBP7759013.1 PleD family two-component system response regulator [Alphaproteobacteria bacterium]MBP7762287.1 PleD family two-component system response regulator [Alphaproteobacteria bacterium]MBP7905480.1 PleD family two-component system response regulator [Alphaproteobacteria bacterium]
MSARVLVVDDILPNVKLLEAKLSTEYYEVLTATSGAEALKKIATDNPDIVLLDVMMPGMDGFEVCSIIKRNPETAHIPVVMVTALTDAQDKVRGLEAGADDFLSKPINDTALMARVRSLVRLKMALDEWRLRENAATQFGAVTESPSVMTEPVEGARVLVIEDKEYERTKISETLMRDHNIVMGVDNGAKGIELIAKYEFDIIMVSLNLENEDGLRLCSHLKSNERTRSVPIVMIAEPDDMVYVAHGLEIGAHDYIMRPLDKNELLARVRTQIRRKRFQERLRSTYEISLNMALTDSLTGLYNRRYFEVHLEKLLQKNLASRKAMAVIMLDIDHFKSVNDTYGHNVGDEVLKTFGDRLTGSLRSFDLVARLGGEEFVVLLPDISKERAYLVAERLRRSIAERPFPCNVEGGFLKVTASLGAAVIEHGGHQIHEVLDRADKCLYEAKRGGRNCTVFEEVGKIDPDKYKESARANFDDEGGFAGESAAH